ncbi:alpha/beta hydrolase fold domain-containing protein [Brevibacterium atlanticum]|uniref:alpha/beta hydrolase fold domain-containing protein n=1 Tax=Brevibacterium atlanticum TaxID=2697563 RepID=UPI001D18A613|nr:alpha/beta hydrolase fold domain-containing protein [Brevibacterium atlanticum]
MIPGVTVDSELTEELLATIPTDIVEAMSPQMREVLSIQAARAEECRAIGEMAANSAGELSPADRDTLAKRAEYRAERTLWNEGGPIMARTDDRHIRAAGVDVPIRIHRPTAEAVLPGIVFLHGGGYSVGDLDTHDRIMRVLAEATGSAVIGVDYSLSPEAAFPQALHECAAIVDDLARHGREYGLDGARLAAAGDSAGASLAIGAALLLRDEPEVVAAAPASFASLRALISIYGGHGLVDSASRRLFGGDWDGMGAGDLNNLMSEYFASPDDAESSYVAHLTADLTGLPPVFVAAAGLDPLRDDSRALARTLQRAGTEVTFEEYPHVLHSFLHFGRVLDDTTTVLRHATAFAARQLR